MPLLRLRHLPGDLECDLTVSAMCVGNEDRGRADTDVNLRELRDDPKNVSCTILLQGGSLAQLP